MIQITGSITTKNCPRFKTKKPILISICFPNYSNFLVDFHPGNLLVSSLSHFDMCCNSLFYDIQSRAPTSNFSITANGDGNETPMLFWDKHKPLLIYWRS